MACGHLLLTRTPEKTGSDQMSTFWPDWPLLPSSCIPLITIFSRFDKVVQGRSRYNALGAWVIFSHDRFNKPVVPSAGPF